MATETDDFDRVEQFRSDMGDHPLGDRVSTKAVGRYVLELYENPIMTRHRRRNDLPVQGVVTVHRYVPEDVEHYRDWFAVASVFLAEDDAREAFDALDSEDGVEGWAREHSDDDDPAFTPEQE